MYEYFKKCTRSDKMPIVARDLQLCIGLLDIVLEKDNLHVYSWTQTYFFFVSFLILLLFDKEIDLLTNPENNFVSDSKEDISSESVDGEVSDIIDD